MNGYILQNTISTTVLPPSYYNTSYRGTCISILVFKKRRKKFPYSAKFEPKWFLWATRGQIYVDIYMLMYANLFRVQRKSSAVNFNEIVLQKCNYMQLILHFSIINSWVFQATNCKNKNIEYKKSCVLKCTENIQYNKYQFLRFYMYVRRSTTM